MENFFKLFPRAQHAEQFNSSIANTLKACGQLNRLLTEQVVAATGVHMPVAADGSVKLSSFRVALAALKQGQATVTIVRLLYAVEALCALTLGETPMQLPEWASPKVKAKAVKAKAVKTSVSLDDALAFIGSAVEIEGLEALINEAQTRLRFLQPTAKAKAKAKAMA